MIAAHVRAAIVALLEVDAGATEAERERVTIALGGARPRGATVGIREAARMLGVHRNTIGNWIRSGRLDAVLDAGGRAMGVTEQSLARI